MGRGLAARRQSHTHNACDLEMLFSIDAVVERVTGQLADTPTRGLPTRGLDKSRTGQLADTDYMDIK